MDLNWLVKKHGTTDTVIHIFESEDQARLVAAQLNRDYWTDSYYAEQMRESENV